MWEGIKMLGKNTHTPPLDEHWDCVFRRRQYDRCDRSPELHICGGTNSLWVGRSTHPKKRCACKTGDGNDWKTRGRLQDRRRGFCLSFCIAGEMRFAPGKRDRCHPPAHAQNALAVQTLYSFNPDLRSCLLLWKQMMTLKLVDLHPGTSCCEATALNNRSTAQPCDTFV